MLFFAEIEKGLSQLMEKKSINICFYIALIIDAVTCFNYFVFSTLRFSTR